MADNLFLHEDATWTTPAGGGATGATGATGPAGATGATGGGGGELLVNTLSVIGTDLTDWYDESTDPDILKEIVPAPGENKLIYAVFYQLEGRGPFDGELNANGGSAAVVYGNDTAIGFQFDGIPLSPINNLDPKILGDQFLPNTGNRDEMENKSLCIGKLGIPITVTSGTAAGAQLKFTVWYMIVDLIP